MSFWSKGFSFGCPPSAWLDSSRRILQGGVWVGGWGGSGADDIHDCDNSDALASVWLSKPVLVAGKSRGVLADGLSGAFHSIMMRSAHSAHVRLPPSLPPRPAHAARAHAP